MKLLHVWNWAVLIVGETGETWDGWDLRHPLYFVLGTIVWNCYFGGLIPHKAPTRWYIKIGIKFTGVRIMWPSFFKRNPAGFSTRQTFFLYTPNMKVEYNYFNLGISRPFKDN